MRFVSPAAILALSATLSACSAGGGRIVGPTPDGSGPLPDAGALPDGSVISDAAPPDARELPDAMPIDPFDPASACGSSAIPTERVPGSLLILFDRSGSMSDPPSSSGGMISKWDLSKSAINTALAAQPDALGVGLMLFPTGEGSECSVSLSPTVPHVPIDLLGTTRALITSELNASGAGGGNTPIFSALAAGYDYLDTLSTPGQRGLLLVTDGAETCDPMSTDAILARALAEREANGYLTFAVGLTQNNNILSTLAVNGGTPRNDSCLATCTAETCYSDADCGGAACEKPTDLFPLPGVLNLPGTCSCTAIPCPAPLTCETIPFIGTSSCAGAANCCHFNATASTFETDFEAALGSIARRFLDSCVFDLPRGADPSAFDPSYVNVGVTFTGEERTVLRRSGDSSVDSWDYTSPDQSSIIVQGPICDRLLAGGATVEIVLGCPTILI